MNSISLILCIFNFKIINNTEQNLTQLKYCQKSVFFKMYLLFTSNFVEQRIERLKYSLLKSTIYINQFFNATREKTLDKTFRAFFFDLLQVLTEKNANKKYTTLGN